MATKSYYYVTMVDLKISPPPFPNRKEYPFTASVRYRGMTIDVENLDGSVRSGTDAQGKKWSTKFNGAHYGELRGSLGTDGDKLDVYIKSNPDDGSNKAYIVHQQHPRTHPTKAEQYDEDKVILGVSSLDAAKELYLRHYNRKDFFRSMTEMSIERFKRLALKEDKGEKIASERKKSNASSAFIRMKMREGSGDKPMKKTALDEAYEAGVKYALEEYTKTSYVGSGAKSIPVIKPTGFMKVIKKPVGSPPTVGKIPSPPKVSLAAYLDKHARLMEERTRKEARDIT